ncbi:MAG: murein L,D-transpeptidase, partial [Rhodospirillales bacterium]
DTERSPTAAAAAANGGHPLDPPAASAEAAEAAAVTVADVVALLDDEAATAAVPEPFRQALKAFYGGPAGTVLWRDAVRQRGLIERLARAEDDGLLPSHYPLSELVTWLQVGEGGPAPGPAALREVAFGAAFLSYASDLKFGRRPPLGLPAEQGLPTGTIDGGVVLAALAAAPDLGTFLAAWAPHNPEYRALRDRLAEYRRIAATGAWPVVAAGETLRSGMRGSRVATLRARLEASGDLADVSGDPELFDPALTAAVERFQRRHGLDVDGVVGRATLAALNVPITDRIQQIILNMERWRWLPDDLGGRHVRVNIAGFELAMVEDGAVVDRMAVVVGRPYRQTPVFSDHIRYLELHPYWSVPFKLAGEDELPKIQRDPSILDQRGFEVFLGNQKVDPATIDWWRYNRRTFPFTLRQKPGPDNALGRIKFMFPNEFDVYLHDTPARALFDRTERAFSSGCIRIERPFDLAVWLLRDTPRWDAERLEARLAAGRNQRIDLARPVAIHLIYATAWSGEDGTVHFRPDIYDRDKRLSQALFGS